MKTFSIYEAKTNLSKLIRDVLSGKRIVIAKAKEPLVELVPFRQKKKTHRIGWYKNAIQISDDFDAPLEDFKEYYNGDSG